MKAMKSRELWELVRPGKLQLFWVAAHLGAGVFLTFIPEVFSDLWHQFCAFFGVLVGALLLGFLGGGHPRFLVDMPRLRDRVGIDELMLVRWVYRTVGLWFWVFFVLWTLKWSSHATLLLNSGDFG